MSWFFGCNNSHRKQPRLFSVLDTPSPLALLLAAEISFFKYEAIYLNEYDNQQELQQSIQAFIHFYNYQRYHQSLDPTFRSNYIIFRKS